MSTYGTSSTMRGYMHGSSLLRDSARVNLQGGSSSSSSSSSSSQRSRVSVSKEAYDALRRQFDVSAKGCLECNLYAYLLAQSTDVVLPVLVGDVMARAIVRELQKLETDNTSTGTGTWMGSGAGAETSSTRAIRQYVTWQVLLQRLQNETMLDFQAVLALEKRLNGSSLSVVQQADLLQHQSSSSLQIISGGGGGERERRSTGENNLVASGDTTNTNIGMDMDDGVDGSYSSGGVPAVQNDSCGFGFFGRPWGLEKFRQFLRSTGYDAQPQQAHAQGEHVAASSAPASAHQHQRSPVPSSSNVDRREYVMDVESISSPVPASTVSSTRAGPFAMLSPRDIQGKSTGNITLPAPLPWFATSTLPDFRSAGATAKYDAISTRIDARMHGQGADSGDKYMDVMIGGRDSEDEEHMGGITPLSGPLASKYAAQAQAYRLTQHQVDLLQQRLTPVDESMKQKVVMAMRGASGGSEHVLVSKFKVDIKHRDFVTLKPGAWLNDEVVNFYMCMLQERDTLLCEMSTQGQGQQSRVASHYFSSGFITRLMNLGVGGSGQYDYPGVKRWTKKFDIFSLNMIFIPINISNSHWTLLVVDMPSKEVVFYDSMNGTGQKYLDAIKRWIGDEANEKKKVALPYDLSAWKLTSCQPHVPQQGNGFDCGVFSMVCADYITDRLPISFYGQEDMGHFRVKIASSILAGEVGYV